MSHVNITMTQTLFSMFFLPLSTLFVRGGVHSTMLNAVNPGLRPQTAGTQICCFNYQISKTNNKSALDRDTSGKQTRWGLTGGYRRILNLKDGRKSPHVLYNGPYVVILTVQDTVIPLWYWKRSQEFQMAVLGLRDLFCCGHWNKVCLFNARLNPTSKTKICSVLRWPSECFSPAFEVLIIFYES